MKLWNSKSFVIGLTLLSNQLTHAQNVSLDSIYATNGVKTSTISNANHGFSQIVMLPNNTILVLGNYDSPGQGILVKVLPSGAYDNTFGTNGEVFFATTTPDFSPIKLIVQPDNKILAIGGAASTNSVRLFRFLSNGNPDNTFGTNGESVITFTNTGLTPQGACLLPNGKIIISGFVLDPPFYFPTDMVMRLNSNGSLDNTFSTNGIITALNAGTGVFSSRYKNVVPSTNKSILLAGTIINLNGFGMVLTKLDSTGAVVGSFGSNGHYIAHSLTESIEGITLAVQSNGEIILGAQLSNTSSSVVRFGLFNLNANGTINNNFGLGGKRLINSSAFSNFLTSLTLTNDGKITALMANTDTIGLTISHSLLRINPNGTMDSTFNSSGEKEIFVMNNNSDMGDLAIQSDGKIIVCGALNSPVTFFEGIIARYKYTGPSAVKLVNVMSPNGGENWNANTNRTIQWNSTGVGKVNVLYKINNSPWVSIANNINNTGTTQWTTPNIASNKYKILIQDATDWSVLDTSNTNFTISVPTFISEKTLDVKVNLFPNPSKDYLNIEVGINEPLEIKVINQLGQLVQAYSFTNTTIINTTTYKDGIYFMTLQNKDYQYTGKFIIQH